MEEELRPALREPVLVYGLDFVLIMGLASAAVFSLSLPPFAVVPVEALAMLFASVLLISKSASALSLHLNERYYLGDGMLRIQRGRVSRHIVTVLLQGVTEVGVEMPLLLRIFGVGTVWVYTFNCRARPLYNLKDARGVAGKMRPSPVWEPVFRPSAE